MSVVVVDASVAVKWFLDEPGHAEARELLLKRDALIAPDLVVTESLNVLWKRWRRRELDAGQVDDIAASLPSLFRELVPASAVASAAIRYARELDHPVYDCLYLALAEARTATLITADDRLLRRVAGRALGQRVRPLL